MLKLEKVSKIYHEVLFEDVTFILGNNEKIGLVGMNGCGKSTLLKIITGEIESTTGQVDLVKEKLEYLPQEYDLTNSGEIRFLGEYLEGLVDDIYSEMWKVDKQLGLMEFGEVDELQEISTLSPGQKMKLYLIKLLLNNPTILLLDEPTNHLDITGIEWLEGFLSKFKGIIILISHDREFLNQAVDHIMEIDEQAVHIYPGNYDQFIIEKQKRLEERAKQFKLQEARRQKIEDMIALIKKQGGGRKQAKKLSSATKRMEREVLSTEINQYSKSQMGSLSIKGSVHSGKGIIQIKKLNFGYNNDSEIFEDAELEVFGSQIIWLQGANGTGKSTLIKLITAELQPTSGEIKWGNAVRWSYFAQNNSLSEVDLSVQEYFTRETNVDWSRSFGVLGRFMFDSTLRDKPVSKLSPGQKARLLFAIFTQQEYECMILDEPTNHLDIETKQAIEHALIDYQGAIILVSHDRYFASQLDPDTIITIQDKKLIRSR